MRQPIIWMFSGQGSQYYHMGMDLYKNNEVFYKTMDRCSAYVEKTIELSLSNLIFQPRADRFAPFDRTLYTHPALFSIQFSLAQTLLNQGLRPDMIMGYSLGEWIAMAVAKVLSEEDVLDLLLDQAQCIERESELGGMLAILDSPELRDQHPHWFQNVTIAAHNFDKHFVVTGQADKITTLEERLNERNIMAKRLPVSHAFHSPLMDTFKKQQMTQLQSLEYKPSTSPIYSCRGEDITHADRPTTLWESVRHPVDFPKTLAALEATSTPTYIDCGPSGTMATFAKYNLPREAHHRCVAIITPFGRNQEKLEMLQQSRQSEPTDRKSL